MKFKRTLAQVGSLAVLAGISMQVAASVGGPGQPVPEPGPLGLLMFGAVALVVARRVTKK